MQFQGCLNAGRVIALDRFTIGRCEVLGGNWKLGETADILNLDGSGVVGWLTQLIENDGPGGF